MGFSTPKTPFNLAEFLSQKGSPRSMRKPTWKRRPAVETSMAEDDAMDTDETLTDGIAGAGAVGADKSE